MMAMPGEKAAVSGVTAPDELLIHPLVTVGLILAVFAAVSDCHAGSPVPCSSRSKRPAGSRVDLSLVAID